jgi:hypothetical protein
VASIATAMVAHVLVVAVPAALAVVDDPQADTPDALSAHWDGPTVSLDWRGQTYATASGSFVGTPVSVPGDESARTLKVRNDGPCAATLTVEVTDAVTAVPQGSVNREAEDLISLRWDVNGTIGGKVFSDIVQEQPKTLARVPVARGESVPVTVGYVFPYEATTGQKRGRPSTTLSFGVRLVLQGDQCSQLDEHRPVASNSPESPAASESAGPSRDSIPQGTATRQAPTPSRLAGRDTGRGTGKGGGEENVGGDAGAMAHTGARVAAVATPAAIALVACGVLLLTWRRRRDADDRP